MDEKQKERLFAILNVWQILRKANVRINDGKEIVHGLFLRFTGKHILRLYFSKKQEFSLDIREISNIMFTNKKSYRIDMTISMLNGNIIYIEAN